MTRIIKDAEGRLEAEPFYVDHKLDSLPQCSRLACGPGSWLLGQEPARSQRMETNLGPVSFVLPIKRH